MEKICVDREDLVDILSEALDMKITIAELMDIVQKCYEKMKFKECLINEIKRTEIHEPDEYDYGTPDYV